MMRVCWCLMLRSFVLSVSFLLTHHPFIHPFAPGHCAGQRLGGPTHPDQVVSTVCLSALAYRLAGQGLAAEGAGRLLAGHLRQARRRAGVWAVEGVLVRLDREAKAIESTPRPLPHKKHSSPTPATSSPATCWRRPWTWRAARTSLTCVVTCLGSIVQMRPYPFLNGPTHLCKPNQLNEMTGVHVPHLRCPARPHGAPERVPERCPRAEGHPRAGPEVAGRGGGGRDG